MNLRVDMYLHKSWNSTPILYHSCRIEFNVSTAKLSSIFENKYYSACVASQQGCVIVINIDAS